MNTFKKIIFVVVVTVLIAVSMCPISVFAVNADPITFPCQEPHVSSFSGYIAFGGSHGYDPNYGYLLCYNITPVTNSSMSYVGDTPLLVLDSITVNPSNRDRLYISINGDEYTTYVLSMYSISSSGDFNAFPSMTFSGNYSNYVLIGDGYFDTLYFDPHGNIDCYGIDLPTFNYLFTDGFYDYFCLVSIIEVLNEYGELTEDELKLLQDILDSNDSVELLLEQINTEFGSKLDTIISDNEVFKKVLRDLLDSSLSIGQVLDSFYEETVASLYLIESDLLEIWMSVDELESNTDEIESLLQQILDALTGSGESDFTEFDTSALDQYYEAESNLMDKVQLSAPMNIDINRNALTFCWNTVEGFLNSNGKVLTAVFVVLTLGIIALALGR